MVNKTIKTDICLELFDIGAVKFGSFKLKDGSMSPIYVDLRMLASYPKLLKLIAKQLVEISKDLGYDTVAGIPYAALCIACAFSLETGKPMIYPRKEVKEYGTRKQIEGVFNAGDKILVIDDLITKGLSKIEAIRPLEEQGLIVKDIVVLLDREQGGKEAVQAEGYSLHAVLSLSEMLDILLENKRITDKQYEELKAYLGK